jgi:hypothetical protein
VAISSSPASPSGPLTVAVIGSARLSPPDPRCERAAGIGAAIAAAGWTLVTGGYGGLMEVASHAAAAAGGRVIGLPMRQWDHLTPNRWNSELRWSASYAERLAHLLAADAVVAVDGGIGTLSEASIVWAALQTEPGAAGLIFLGPGWPPVLEALAANLVIDQRDLALATVCDRPEQAIEHIRSASASRPTGRAAARG